MKTLFSSVSSLSARHPAARPDRYRIREDEKGRVLTCVEAPTVTLRVDRSIAVAADEARRYPPGSIFLDGAAQGEPFLDTQKQIHNLDHHEGCVRSFMLATCEQAMVFIRKIADLRKRDWTIYANDADLDTLLAVWVLFNHLRLNDEPRARARIMPLLRLQGIIDAHGLEFQDLAAFPPDMLHSTAAMLEDLRSKEIECKKRGEWSTLDLVAFSAERLRDIDAFVYADTHFEEVPDVTELARVDLGHDSLALVCRSELGIYELEQQLRRLYGKRLGIILLQKDPVTYSVRLSDPSLPGALTDVYERLNWLDPAAGDSRSANRWGGSAEIGGSPRLSGTQLAPEQLAEACRRAFHRASNLERLSQILRASLLSAVALAPGLVLFASWTRIAPRALLASGYVSDPAVPCAAVAAMLSGLLFLLERRDKPNLFSLRMAPVKNWMRTLPMAVSGALFGGVWIPPTMMEMTAQTLAALSAALVWGAAEEVLFRGLAYGILAPYFPARKGRRWWMPSWPVLLSTFLAVLWTGAGLLLLPRPAQSWIGAGHSAMVLGGTFIFGIAAGRARERSESALAPILVHWIGIAAVYFASTM